jgi:hypothetical protein
VETYTDAAQLRDRAYLDLLSYGLVTLRNCAYSGPLELCLVEADPLHNLPSLVGEINERRHEYYIVQERDLYLHRLHELGATEYLQRTRSLYAEPWQVLARAAGVTLFE